MIKIIVLKSLAKEIAKIFKNESVHIYDLMDTVKQNPRKGKKIGTVNDITIKELKYNTFRFYYIFIGSRLFMFQRDNISEVLVKFVKMSKKNNQQKTIEQIKDIIEKLHFDDIE